MLTTEQLSRLSSSKTDERNSAQGSTVYIVVRSISGTTNDYYNQTTWQKETTTEIKATVGYNKGYSYAEGAGGLAESSSVQFAIADSNLTALKAENTWLRWRSEDYAIKEVKELPETDEVLVFGERIK